MTIAVTGKCDSATVDLAVFNSPVSYGSGTREYPMIEGLDAVRIGPVSTPFMLHVITSSEEVECPKLDIQRVVECPNGCDMREYKWSMPCVCTAHYLLPAGVYDITVCKQDVYPMEEGEVLSITFMVEPVSDSFVAVMGNSL